MLLPVIIRYAPGMIGTTVWSLFLCPLCVFVPSGTSFLWSSQYDDVEVNRFGLLRGVGLTSTPGQLFVQEKLG